MYHYADGDVPRGPVPIEALRGRITAQTLVWREGMGDWVAAGTLPELADVLAESAPAPIVTAPIATVATPVAPPFAPPFDRPAAPVYPQGPSPAGQPLPIAYNTEPVQNVPGLAVASLVLGIVGVMTMCAWGLGLICAILAVIFGYSARRQGAVGINPGAPLATVGIILGWIPIGLAGLFLLFILGISIIGALAS